MLPKRVSDHPVAEGGGVHVPAHRMRPTSGRRASHRPPRPSSCHPPLCWSAFHALLPGSSSARDSAHAFPRLTRSRRMQAPRHGPRSPIAARRTPQPRPLFDRLAGSTLFSSSSLTSRTSRNCAILLKSKRVAPAVKKTVSPALRLGSAFEHHDPRARVLRRKCGA